MVNLKTTKMPRPATILITLIGSASLYIAPLAFAQSSEGRAPSVSESDGIPEPPAAVTDDLSGSPISSTDGSSATAYDSSGPPASHTDWEQVPQANSDATSGGDRQVLEVPQSTNPAQASNQGQDNESRNAPDELSDLNDYPYGYDPSDPYVLGYDPYLAWWYPGPIYYYSRRDRDNDCGDGNCGSRVGGHGGLHRPRFGIGTGTTLPGTASHPMPVAGIPHVSSAPAVASAPSGRFGNGGGFGRGGAFGQGGGFGRSGFGNAGGGFGHR
jgi:hypothetical protein